ncbi:MAG: PilZ domain-containing protein [Nitrospiria bacterium]
MSLFRSIDYHRRYPRVNLNLKADFRILHPGKTKDRVELNTTSLGGGGLMIRSPVQLQKGTRVEMRLFHYAHVIEFVAEVAWTEKRIGTKTASFKCGLEYVKISQDGLLDIHHILEIHQYLKSNPLN